jgi:protein required for attachment to host cells
MMEGAAALRRPVGALARKDSFMNTTWILTANRSGATLFETDGKGKPIHRLQDIPHPRGRLRNQDIDADKPGRAFDSHGHGRHGMSTEHESTEEVAMAFARILAELLDKGRTTHAFGKLVLVAEPGFLGLLRGALDPHTAALVVKTVHKDLPEVSEKELASHIE